MPRPGLNLAIAFAAEHRLPEQLANGSHQFCVGQHLWAALLLFPRMPLTSLRRRAA